LKEEKGKTKYGRLLVGLLSSIVSLFGVWYFLFNFFGGTNISMIFAIGFCILIEVSVILFIMDSRIKMRFLFVYIPIVILKLFININSLDKLNQKEYEKINQKQIEAIHQKLENTARGEKAKLKEKYKKLDDRIRADIRYNSAQAARGVEYMRELTLKRESELKALKIEFNKDMAAIDKDLKEKLKEPLSNDEHFFIATGTDNETGKRIISWGGAALLEGLIFWAFFSGFGKPGDKMQEQPDCQKCQKLSLLEEKMSQVTKNNGKVTFFDIPTKEVTKIIKHSLFISRGHSSKKVNQGERIQFDEVKKIMDRLKEVKNADRI
jgi:hypothetical protein